MPVRLYVLSPRAAQQIEDLLAEVAEYTGEERSLRVEQLLYTPSLRLPPSPASVTCGLNSSQNRSFSTMPTLIWFCIVKTFPSRSLRSITALGTLPL